MYTSLYGLLLLNKTVCFPAPEPCYSLRTFTVYLDGSGVLCRLAAFLILISTGHLLLRSNGEYNSSFNCIIKYTKVLRFTTLLLFPSCCSVHPVHGHYVRSVT